MGKATSILKGAGVIIVTVLYLSILFFVANSGSKSASAAMSSVNQVMGRFEEFDVMMYDDMTVSGRDLASIIETTKEKVTVTVTNKAGETRTFASDTSILLLDTIEINPNGNFTGEVTKNANGLCVHLSLTQR